VTQTVNNGTAIQWRYKTSTISGSFSGSYVTGNSLNSSTVSCTTPAVSASHGTCSGGGAPINVLLDNTGQGATNYFKVQYSTDNSNWTDGIGGSHVAVGADSTSTVSLQVHHLQMTLRSIFVIRLLQVQTSLLLLQQL
jgi:hypothetical protein